MTSREELRAGIMEMIAAGMDDNLDPGQITDNILLTIGIAPLPRWRHLKRGTEYVEIGRGFAQCAWTPIEEMTAVVIYRGHDGCLWVRNAVEFDDGRFEPLFTLSSTEGK